MITVKNIPLVHEDDEELGILFSPKYTNNECLMQPVWRYLPDEDEKDNEDYTFFNVKEGLYLVGLKVVADKWVNRGFCGSLFANFGLILQECFPLERKSESSFDKCLVELNFRHITEGVYNPMSYTLEK